MSSNSTGKLKSECAAEFIGTYVLVFFGTGSVHVAVLTGGLVGLWQVAVVWGTAIALAIYATSAISGAHINPAITLAFSVWRAFPRRKIPLYVLSQLLGAIAASATLYALFHNLIGQFEVSKGIIRGAAGSQLSAMLYGEFFPNPAIIGTTTKAFESVTHAQAILAEAIGTAFLAFFVFAVTDADNRNRPSGTFFAVFIGLTVAIVIAIVAPLTQAGLNPARDLGPRLFSYLAGWGSIAIPGPRSGFLTVYILAPCVGASLGAGLYHCVLAASMKQTSGAQDDEPSEGDTNMTPVRLILVGGFLGSGKTTLLAQAAQLLVKQGRRVGLITNDQASDLVDTQILRNDGFSVEEISGGCFCCRFENLVTSADRLIEELRPDILMGEPVGSCTDLSATVIQPLKKLHRDKFSVAPFSVLLDPLRLRELLGLGERKSLPDSVMYVLRKQLEEADVIVINKADRISSEGLERLTAALERAFPGTPTLVISALTGDGVAAWLDLVMEARPSGVRIADVDYDTYAEGEAVLGWLNASIQLHAEHETDWQAVCRGLLGEIQRQSQARSAEITHVKLHLSTSDGSLVANVTSTQGEPSIRGHVRGAPHEAELILNARVHLGAAELRAVVESSLDGLASDGIEARANSIRSFSPARPQPTHRFKAAV